MMNHGIICSLSVGSCGDGLEGRAFLQQLGPAGYSVYLSVSTSPGANTVRDVGGAAVLGSRSEQQRVITSSSMANRSRCPQRFLIAPCDALSLSGSRATRPEVLAVYAVKTTSDPTNGQEVVIMDDTKKELLKQVFWDMNELSSFTSTVPDEGNDEEDMTILHITVTAKTADETADVYGFNAGREWPSICGQIPYHW